MKLVSYESGRITFFFSPDDVRPKQGVSALELVQKITERYSFPTQPELPPGGEGGVKFQNGILASAEPHIVIRALVLFNDALIVETHSTEQSTAVLNDIIRWAGDEFEMRIPQTATLEFFESAIVIEFQKPIDHVLRAFDILRDSLCSEMERIYRREFDIHLHGFSLGTDPGELPSRIAPFLRTEFSVIRRVNRPFSENRFFSVAPLPTDMHVSLLERFEKAALD